MCAKNRKLNKPLQQKTGKEYALQIIRQRGVACVSVVDSGHYYSVHGDKEPANAKVFKGFHEKKKRRGRILVKLGIWENGRNSQPLKKQE